MRVFLAFDITDTLRGLVAEWQEHLRQRGVRARWTAPGKTHLTALFVGDIADIDVPLLTEAARSACKKTAAFTGICGQPDVFGRVPRVIFLSVQDNPPGAFAAFAGCLRQAAKDAGINFPEADHDPHPHLTIARFRNRQESDTVRKVCTTDSNGLVLCEASPATLELAKKQVSACFSVLTLYKSTLYPQGPEYEALARFPLAGTGLDGRDRQ